MGAKVSVVIPTFGPARFARWAVSSVQRQTVKDLEILIACDGSPDDTVVSFHNMAREDPRIRVLTFPKAAIGTSPHTDSAIQTATGDIICYCGHDDLWLPNHAAVLQEVLSNNVFATTVHAIAHLPRDASREGRLLFHVYLQNIAEAGTRQKMLEKHNFYGLTFCAHTRDAYLTLEKGWQDTAPEGIPTDLYMWQKFVRMYGDQCRSVPRLTALQFSAKRRAALSVQDRYDELRTVFEQMQKPGFAEEIEDEFYAILSNMQNNLDFTLRMYRKAEEAYKGTIRSLQDEISKLRTGSNLE